MKKQRIALISTGGTVEKTYNELEGVLHNAFSVLDVMLASLSLENLELVRVPLMNKDSVEMTAADHSLIAETVGAMCHAHDGVVVLHGTDRLANTGERIVEIVGTPRVPIILTGAIRPYMLRNTDALQNLTAAFLAVQILSPGVFCVIHNKVLQFPGVVKDHEGATFRYANDRDE